MRIIGLIIFIAGMGIGIGANISAMLHLQSAAMVVGGTLGLLLFGGSRIGPMFSSVFRCSIPAADLLQAARDWKLAAAYLLASGVIGTLIGLVIMLKNMDDPAALGPGMAIAVLAILYGVIVGLGICLPLAVRLENRAGEQSSQS